MILVISFFLLRLCSSSGGDHQLITTNNERLESWRGGSLRELEGTLEMLMRSGQTDATSPEVIHRVNSTLNEIRGLRHSANLVWIVWTVAGLVPVMVFVYYRFRTQ
jgi:hypothetical protein